MRVCAAAFVVAALLAAAAPAQAGDPIMPLSEVHGGMHCTAYSVVQGTAISTFDVDVMDVVDGQPGDDARILVHVSGPAVDATGIGPGFSGSPIYCLDARGVARNIGAISETIGDYGGHTVLVTPIEQILGTSPDPPRGARSAPRLLRSAHPLAGPLTISGVSPALGRVLAAKARKAGRLLIAVPAGPLGSFPVQELRPGAAVSIGYSSGDVALGALGTVAYVDGDKVWAFGHSLDSVGPRSLILQDAYIYSVINNPVALGDAITYKLGAPGHDVGILTNDTLDAVAGHVGPTPPETAMRVLARNLDTGKVALTEDKVADETALNLPTGSSPLSLVAPTVLAQASARIAQSSPVQQSGSMCLRIRVRELRKPMGFCNRYVSTGGSGDSSGDTSAAGGAAAGSMIEDLSSALGMLDSYRLGLVHTTDVTASVRLANGLREAFLLAARAPRSARRGTTIRVGLLVREPRGPRRRLVIRLRVPVGTPRGDRDLVISGSPEDAPGGDLGSLLGDLSSPTIELDLGPPEGAENGPRSLAAVALGIAALQRYDGLRARFVAPGGHAGSEDDPSSEGRRVYRHPTLRLSGRVRVPIRITAGRGRR